MFLIHVQSRGNSNPNSQHFMVLAFLLKSEFSGFETAFKRTLRADRDVFLVPPQANILAAHEDRASSRGNFIWRSGSRADWRTDALLDVLRLPEVVGLLAQPSTG